MHVITGLQAGGAEMMLFKLLAAQSGLVRHIVVSLGDGGVLAPRISALGVDVHHLGLQPWAPNPIRLFRLRGLTRKVRPHIIQGWMPHGNLIASLARRFSPDRPSVLWNIRMSLSDVHKEPLIT